MGEGVKAFRCPWNLLTNAPANTPQSTGTTRDTGSSPRAGRDDSRSRVEGQGGTGAVGAHREPNPLQEEVGQILACGIAAPGATSAVGWQ